MPLTVGRADTRRGIVVTTLPAPRRAMLPVAVDATGKEMLLNFNALASILAAMHGIEPDQVPALVSRLKYMQSHGFPLPSSGRRTRQPSLGLDEALKIALAFEFLQAGMSPIRAVRLASTDWEEFATIAATARTTGTGKSLAVFEPRALLEFARMEVKPDEPLNELVGAMDVAQFGDAAADPRASNIADESLARHVRIGRSARLIAIDTRHFLQAFAIACERTKPGMRADVDRAIALWSEEVVGVVGERGEHART